MNGRGRENRRDDKREKTRETCEGATKASPIYTLPSATRTHIRKRAGRARAMSDTRIDEADTKFRGREAANTARASSTQTMRTIMHKVADNSLIGGGWPTRLLPGPHHISSSRRSQERTHSWTGTPPPDQVSRDHPRVCMPRRCGAGSGGDVDRPSGSKAQTEVAPLPCCCITEYMLHGVRSQCVRGIRKERNLSLGSVARRRQRDWPGAAETRPSAQSLNSLRARPLAAKASHRRTVLHPGTAGPPKGPPAPRSAQREQKYITCRVPNASL